MKLNAFNWIGGKASHLPFLYENFPDTHHHYIDVFGGSGVVLLNKKPSPIETFNDINQNIVTFYRVLRNNKDNLIEKIKLSPYSRQEYADCITVLKNQEADDLERARAFFVVANQSYHSRINSLQEYNWKINIHDSTKRGSSVVSKYNSKIEKLDMIADRFKSVQIENRDFKRIFDKFDSDVSFFYVDPPYPLDTRRTKKLYDYELDDDRHSELLEIIQSIEGSVLISTYQNEMYDSKLTNWKKVSNSEKRIRSSSTKRKAVEILYRNFEINVSEG